MSDKTGSGMPADMSVDDLRLNILVVLSTRLWHDVTANAGIPDATEVLGCGVTKGRQPIFALCLYEDGQRVLVSTHRETDEWRSVGAEQHQLDWLRENLQRAP